MSSSPRTAAGPDTELRELAGRHLWRHFAPSRSGNDLPVIVRGDGCDFWDDAGVRYLDGLSALFAVQIGHGRTDVANAGATQAELLGFSTVWWYPNEPAARLAARVANLAPGDLNRVFFTSGGSEAVESAIKLVRDYHARRGNPEKVLLIARQTSYHGTTMGALTATGISSLREQFQPLLPGVVHVPNTNTYRLDDDQDPLDFAEAIDRSIRSEGADRVAAVFLEPLQNGGGCIPPPDGYFQRVREICDEHDVLLVSDEVIGSWGRLGTWFGCQRYGYQPDIVTTAKGITSGYAPLGAMIVSDRVAAEFEDAPFVHGFTYGGHPMAAAIALANIDAMEDEQVLANVRRNEPVLRQMLESLGDIPMVGDVRGGGYFWAVELVADQKARARFSPEVAAATTKALTPELHRRGLFCRADNRGDPVIQLAPPLIAGEEEFTRIHDVVRPLLEETSVALGVG